MILKELEQFEILRSVQSSSPKTEKTEKKDWPQQELRRGGNSGDARWSSGEQLGSQIFLMGFVEEDRRITDPVLVSRLEAHGGRKTSSTAAAGVFRMCSYGCVRSDPLVGFEEEVERNRMVVVAWWYDAGRRRKTRRKAAGVCSNVFRFVRNSHGF